MEGKGVLCHLTSLPEQSLSAAVTFLDWLKDNGYTSWQMLPLTPPDKHGSPYASPTAFAAWPELMSAAEKEPMKEDDYWLDDWALYAALKDAHNPQPWYEGPSPLRDRDPGALDRYRQSAAVHLAQQQRFQGAWNKLAAAAKGSGVSLVGDVPMFVAHDSADVWAHRELFQLDDDGMPVHVAGVPPDYFSEGGQKWGTVLYNWEAHEKDGWRWWKERMKRMLRLFDVVRIDHFRGLHSNWAVPVEDTDARSGFWQDGPGDELLNAILPDMEDPGSILAEDLGIIPDEVIELRRRFGIPGMAVLHFGFDGQEMNPHHPLSIASDQVVYTGTHDNNTTLGWWKALDVETKQRVQEHLREGEAPSEGLIRMALESSGCGVMVPLQDVLGLDASSRMNTPGTFDGNWKWRFGWQDLFAVKNESP